MSFPANEVEQAMLEASADPSRMGRFLAALRAGELWVPVTADPEQGRSVTLYTVDVDGRPHTVVFTSHEQLSAWADGVPHVVAPTPSFVESLPPAAGLAVNPGGQLGLPLPPEAVADLGSGRQTVPAGTRLRIGEPAQEPVEVLAQVSYALGEVPHVQAARRAWVQMDDAPPSLAVGLSLRPGADEQAVLAAVRAAFDDVLRRSAPGFAIDVVALDGATDPIASWMQANADPFYAAT